MPHTQCVFGWDIYLVFVTPVSSTLSTCRTTNFIGSTGGLHDMTTTKEARSAAKHYDCEREIKLTTGSVGLAVCYIWQRHQDQLVTRRVENIPNLVSFLGRFIMDISLAICFSISSSSSSISSLSSFTTDAFGLADSMGHISAEYYRWGANVIMIRRHDERRRTLTFSNSSESSPTAIRSFPRMHVIQTLGPLMYC